VINGGRVQNEVRMWHLLRGISVVSLIVMVYNGFIRA
jgi:hypothetical protein